MDPINDQPYPFTLQQLLHVMVEQGASDLHLTTGSPPIIRLDGSLVALKTPPLGSVETKLLCYSVLSEEQKVVFEKKHELDFSFGVKGLSRFRGNLYMQRGAVGGAFRTIPYRIRTFEELGLPAVVEKLANLPRGLVLITGPTGSGKSTTLAAILDKINREKRLHIVTIEDPIEYMHNHKLSVVNQRELGSDTQSFKEALKHVLRQDPDVVLVGEMRDLETIEAAMTISETGHLVFATLHTNSAIQSINRVIDVFPPHQQPQIRAQLSFVLQGVVSQLLIPKKGTRGRVPAIEVLVLNTAVRNLIREDKIHQVYSIMQSGQGISGMQTMSQDLANLYVQGQITYEDASSRAVDVNELDSMIRQAQGQVAS